jgi:hypothetical protein
MAFLKMRGSVLPFLPSANICNLRVAKIANDINDIPDPLKGFLKIYKKKP